MNENLSRRKADVKKYLEEQFKERPQKWWQFKSDDYIPTRNMGSGKNDHPHTPEETIVEYDFKRALGSGALFLCGCLAISVICSIKEEGFPFSFLLMVCLAMLFSLFQLLDRNKKGPLILFNKAGFWVKTMPQPVPWVHLVASYIRKDHSGEQPVHYLLLYYYDETKDEFSEVEYCIDGLDMSKEDIALLIEYWKMLKGNSWQENNGRI
jgi:hypothetical protein